MSTLQYLDPWLIDYSSTTRYNIVRSQAFGKTNQSRKSHRKIDVARAQRILVGAQVPYFEWFIRGINNDGQSKFTDYYTDGSGVQQGEVRIRDGSYTLTPIGGSFRVECIIEVFR